MIRTRLCEMLQIQYPIIAAPMGAVTGPELTAAVSNAGGLGIMGTGNLPPTVLRQLIRRLRELTTKPFGVNLLTAFPQQENVTVCLEEKVPLLSFYLGDPSPYIQDAHAAGCKVVQQIGSVSAAKQAVQNGVDFVIAQGAEAGGHTTGQVTTLVLTPRVVDAIAPVPVACAGGIADARGLVAALALGAEAVVMGTRFLAATEAGALPAYKQKVLAATEEDTVQTSLFGNNPWNTPHRVIRTPFVEQWLGHEVVEYSNEPVVAELQMGNQSMPIKRFMKPPPTNGISGNLEMLPYYAGQSVGLVHEIKGAGEIVRELMEGAELIIQQRL